MSDIVNTSSHLETPQSIVREIMEINHAAKECAIPQKPANRLTTKETLERDGLSENFLRVSALGGLVVVALLLAVKGFVLGWDTALPVSEFWAEGLVMISGMVLGVFSQTKAAAKFWTRVIRKKHYLSLHENEKSEQALAIEAYETSLAKHKQVTERLAKRSTPVIEAYTSANPLKKIEFADGRGLVVTDRYEPEAQVALEISAGMFSGGNEDANKITQAKPNRFVKAIRRAMP